MRILILYASIEGQTRKIADRLAARLEAGGADISMMNVDAMAEYALERPQGIVLAAPIHAGQYPKPFADFIAREREPLSAVPLAFVSVTLSIGSDNAEERAEAEAFPRDFAARLGIEPDLIHDAMGALKFSEYDFFKRWMLKRIAAKEGHPVDGKSDVEFTDWAALDAFADRFKALVAAAN